MQIRATRRGMEARILAEEARWKARWKLDRNGRTPTSYAEI
jgi:hypothetical protein